METEVLYAMFRIFCLLLLLLFTPAAASDYQRVVVSRHTDGDTFYVKDSAGREYKVRLIGVNTPETKHPSKGVEVYGKEASDFTARMLPKGKTVYLEKDVSETDRYGRLLRYVWLQQPAKSAAEQELRGKMLNAVLLSEGYARVSTYPPDVKYAENFRKLERGARGAKKGLWAYDGKKEPAKKKTTVKKKRKKKARFWEFWKWVR